MRTISKRVGPAPRVPARWLARLVTLVGLVDIIAMFMPHRMQHLGLVTDVIPLIGRQTARAVTGAAGLLLVYLGTGLRRRKREAWWMAVVLAATSVAANLVKGFDIDSAALSAVVLAALLASRDEFPAKHDRVSRWRALGVAAGFAVAGFVVGLAEIALRPSALVPGQPVRWWFLEVAYGMVGVGGPLRYANAAAGDAIMVTTATMGLLAGGVAVVGLLRPAPARPGHTTEDAERLRSLLDRHGARDSLGYFALRPDKSLIFSPSGKAAVAYRVLSGVSLASGDPLGDPEAWPGAIAAWLAEARGHGWRPSVIGCSEQAGNAYRRHGLDAIELGDEAILDVGQFNLDGRPMRGVRQAVGRVARAGYVCQIGRQKDLPAAVVKEAVATADRFRDGGVERGFSMALSRIGHPDDGDCLLVLARDADGQVRGVLQFVPWGEDGFSLDLMRRDPSSDNGLVEFMVTAAVRYVDAMGIARLSLNFAVLRSVFARAERLGAGPVLRTWCRILLVLSRFWQIESLYRANAKYRPDWQPRFFCFASLADLPRVSLAAMRAEALIVVPRPWHRPRREAAPDTIAADETEAPVGIGAPR